LRPFFVIQALRPFGIFSFSFFPGPARPRPRLFLPFHGRLQPTQFFTFLPDMFANRSDNLLVGRLEMTGDVGDLPADVEHLDCVTGGRKYASEERTLRTHPYRLVFAKPLTSIPLCQPCRSSDA